MRAIVRSAMQESVLPHSTLHPHSLAARGNTLRALIELTKPGIVRMVTLTSVIGLILAAVSANWQLLPFLYVALMTVLGTALSAAGANTLNQAMEVARDAAMRRTRNRPIPSERVSRAAAVYWGLVLSILGITLLAFTVHAAAAIVAAASSLTYLLLYTPSKPLSTISTIIGAVPGALPPLIGYAAGASPDAIANPLGGFAGLAEPGGWALFAIMFVWQVPHFLAIAWKYRHEYQSAGLRVLPVIDHQGSRTGRAAILWSCLLLAIAPVAAWSMPSHLGIISTLACAVGALAMLYYSVRLANRRDDASAKALFLASIAYLPAVFFTMVLDAFITVL